MMKPSLFSLAMAQSVCALFLHKGASVNNNQQLSPLRLQQLQSQHLRSCWAHYSHKASTDAAVPSLQQLVQHKVTEQVPFPNICCQNKRGLLRNRCLHIQLFASVPVAKKKIIWSPDEDQVVHVWWLFNFSFLVSYIYLHLDTKRWPHIN